MKQMTDSQIYCLISNNIKHFRSKKGLTQQELADRSNISFSYVSKIESQNCDKAFSISVLNQIANALDVEIIEFFKENDSKMCQLDIIILILKSLDGQASYTEIYAKYEEIVGVRLTDGQKAGIRKTIDDHSSDSMNYKNKGDFFYSVQGKGKGMWGLR